METENFYKNSIDVEGLKEGVDNVRNLDEKTEVVVTKEGSQIKVFRNLCPHMGAPLNQGHLCMKDQSVQCPWHGYIFDLQSGDLKENPNDRTFGWMKNLYKNYKPESTPKFKLQLLTGEIREGKLHIHRSAAKS